MPESTNPRRVLVTGASGGIGRAIAVRLAADGFDIAVHYHRNRDGASATAEAVARAGGREPSLLRFDVADRDATAAALGAELKDRGVFWGLVMNAGIHADAPLPAMKPDAWDRVLRTNLDGFYNVLHPLVMPMVRLREGGRINGQVLRANGGMA